MQHLFHHGRHICYHRLRLRLTPGQLAVRLGDGWNATAIRHLEASPVLTDALLACVSKALNMPLGLFKATGTPVMNIISNTVSFENCQLSAFVNYQPTFQHDEQWARLLEEQRQLYERLLASQQENQHLRGTQHADGTTVHSPTV
jgi:hypothetical protein